MPQVSPSVLAWARETAGLTREEAARKLQIGSARGVAPVDRLRALETGEVHPTRPLLTRMANSYRRPLVAFYLDEPPRPSEIGTDFRTLTGTETSVRQDALVRALVRKIVARQAIIRSQLEDDDAEQVPFIGTVDVSDGRARALEALRQVIGGTSDPNILPRDFKDLRDAVERAGVFVVLQGNLGNHRTTLETTAFRGFVLADRLAPFIVVNSNDARAAWSFTLLHEVVHLLLGQTGISGADADSDIERFCNDVAGEFLLPSSVVDSVDVTGLAPDRLIGTLGRLSSEWNVSRSLVAYRLLRSGKLESGRYHRLAETLRRQWKEEHKQPGNRGGRPDYYTVHRHRIGNALLKTVEIGLGEGVLSTTKAALALGVKPTQVGRILGMRVD